MSRSEEMRSRLRVLIVDPHEVSRAATGRILAFRRGTVGVEVRNETGSGGIGWITVHPTGQPGTSIAGPVP